jgi:hypothetical protein
VKVKLTIDDAMERLVGLAVLALTNDPRSGSLFDLGEWLPRPQRIPNLNLPETQQNYIGSESMLVRCRWELDSPINLVPDETALHGFEQRTRLLETLAGSRIADANFSAVPLEVTLRFESQTTLRLFLARPIFSETTLTLRFRELYWTVNASGEIDEESRT